MGIPRVFETMFFRETSCLFVFFFFCCFFFFFCCCFFFLLFFLHTIMAHKDVPLRKQAYSNILEILPPKHENFQIKILIFFIFLLKT